MYTPAHVRQTASGSRRTGRRYARTAHATTGTAPLSGSGPLCAGVVLGAPNTNVCPAGSARIGTAAACESAAAAIGKSYSGYMTVPGFPSGCFTNPPFVEFNDHPTGAPYPNMQPLCAGKPLV
jgi:hypothetical protein